MPDPTPVDPAPILARASAATDDTLRDLAAGADQSLASTHRALRRFAPVVEALRQIKRDEFTAAWQSVAIKAVAAMDQFLDGEEPIPVGVKSSVSAEVRNLAVAAGIASEKALLFAGQPTQIGALYHAHRVELPAQAERLATLASRLARLSGTVGSGGPAQGPLEAAASGIIDPDPRNPAGSQGE